MARRKRMSKALETARLRLAGLKAISPPVALGGTLSPESYEAEIVTFSNRQDSYNSKVAELDDETNQLDDLEQRMNDLSQRIVAAVRAQYGPDSSELELLGLVRRSDRKKSGGTPKVPATS